MAITDRSHVRADFLYRRRERPSDPKSLEVWLEEQLDGLERTTLYLEDIPQVSDTPPEAPKIGLRRYALAPWDPGSGPNTWYTWDGAAWQPDGSGGTGAPGQGVPTGGTTGQYLVKVSGTDYDTAWQDLPPISGTGFLPAPDLIDDTDLTHFYFGWVSVGGDWLIHRMLRTTASTQRATSTGNPSFSSLASAWPSRTSLSYS